MTTHEQRVKWGQQGYRATTASMSPQQLAEWRRKGGKAWLRSMSPEQRRQWHQKGARACWAGKNRSERIQWLRKCVGAIPPKQRKENGRKGQKELIATMATEELLQWRQQIGRRGYDRGLRLLTFTQRSRITQRYLESLTPQQRVELAELGRKFGKIRAQSMTHEQWVELGRRANMSMTAEQKSERGRKAARANSSLRPSWSEANFYGLVYGNPITRRGFTAQQSDGNGVYDGAWLSRNIIAELDGGGHHVFRDSHAKDERKDIMRLLDGNVPLRAPSENELFLKALAMLDESEDQTGV